MTDYTGKWLVLFHSSTAHYKIYKLAGGQVNRCYQHKILCECGGLTPSRLHIIEEDDIIFDSKVAAITWVTLRGGHIKYGICDNCWGGEE